MKKRKENLPVNHDHDDELYKHKLIAPVSWSVEMKRVGKTLADIKYSEEFDDHALAKRTADLLTPLFSSIGLKVTILRGKVTLSGRTALDTAATMMVSEFLPFSKYGRITISDMFLTVASSIRTVFATKNQQ